MIMSLEYVARVVMGYLDSVGVAADYYISEPTHLTTRKLDVITSEVTVTIFGSVNAEELKVIVGRLSKLRSYSLIGV